MQSPIIPADRGPKGLCLTFDFTFSKLNEVHVSVVEETKETDVLWKLTIEDRHSVPEGKWMLGQTMVNHTEGLRYWVSQT